MTNEEILILLKKLGDAGAGSWMSAAIEDPSSCQELRDDFNEMLELMGQAREVFNRNIIPEVLNNVERKLRKSMESLEPCVMKAINDNFWNLLGEEDSDAK